jgi:molybdate transport system permease protein
MDFRPGDACMVLSADESTALMLSLRVALWSMLGSLPIAIALALLLARRQFAGKALVEAAIHLPLVLPPVVTGYLLLLALGRQGLVGMWLDQVFGIVLAFRWTGAAVAAAIMGLPLMVQAIRLSIEAVDPRLEQAAAALGARPSWVVLLVTLPLAVPGILAGAVLSFARSLGEFGATITFVGNIPGETRTLPLALYTYTQVPGGEGPALRLVIISVAISLCALMASGWLARRAAGWVRGDDA